MFHAKEDRVRQSLPGSVVRQYPRRGAGTPRPDLQPEGDQPDAAQNLGLVTSYHCIALFGAAFLAPAWPVCWIRRLFISLPLL